MTLTLPKQRTALVVAALALCVLVYTFRVQIAELLLAGTLLRAYARKHLGVRARPKSSWSSLGRTSALMFAAWNTRWLKNTSFKASVPYKVGTDDDPANPLLEP